MDKSFAANTSCRSKRRQSCLSCSGRFIEDSIMIIKTSQGNILFIYKITSLKLLRAFQTGTNYINAN